MNEIDQGGFVHPHVTYEYGEEVHHIGITLRQHYAGLAMQAMVAAEYGSRMTEEVWAKDAHKIADAMIEASKQ